MSKRKNSHKLTISNKVTLSALSLLGVIGAWNVIGNSEKAASVADLTGEEVPSPTPTAVPPTPTPWATIEPLVPIPRLETKPIPTLSADLTLREQPASALAEDQQTGESSALTALPNAAPMPTLAPLPKLPEYVPPPPPPPQPSGGGGGSSSGGGGGGNTSKGS